jgi:urease gamma subunit
MMKNPEIMKMAQDVMSNPEAMKGVMDMFSTMNKKA